MSTAERSKLKLAYEGSVKRVWQSLQDENSLWFEFTDDYSVFDWGKMPDTIANKGLALTLIGAFFFEKLGDGLFWKKLPQLSCLKQFDQAWLGELFAGKVYKSFLESGCPNHFRRLVSDSTESLSLAEAAQGHKNIYIEVAKAAVCRPLPAVLLGQNVFEYPPMVKPDRLRLVPLEVVFRFGMPKGSSLKARLEKDPDYAQRLGLKNKPQEGKYFERPVLEFYTKLEPKDRLLSVQEALLISGLAAGQLQELADVAYLSALALFAVFAERNIELWDGKFEFIADKDKVFLADSIGPDELRLLYKGCHLSKEMIRQVYAGSAWKKSLSEAQKLAAERCSLDWKGICRDELKSSPESFSPDVRGVIDKLYGVIANRLSGQSLFADHPDLDRFLELAKTNGLVEG